MDKPNDIVKNTLNVKGPFIEESLSKITQSAAACQGLGELGNQLHCLVEQFKT